MKHLILLFLSLIIFPKASGQDNAAIQYSLKHIPELQTVEVTIGFKPVKAEAVKLIIPRSAPGTYDLTDYILFVEDVQAKTTLNKTIKGTKGIGSYFEFSGKETLIHSVSYRVDIPRMENVLTGAFASSKHRKNYLGLLGYSIFGFIEELESQPIQLTIETAPDWPVFSTLRPDTKRKSGKDSYTVEHYGMLADAQYLLGNDVVVWQAENTPVPFYVAVYTETDTPVNVKEIGRRGAVSLQGLADYFGFVPMPHYTLCYEFLKPISPKHEYGFGMEHLNSMTSSLDTGRAIFDYDPEAKIGYIVHHIGHSWIPLRAYGKGYRPFEWQTAPLIETIWLNEGFIWYISYYHILKNRNILNRFKNTMATAPEYIKRKSLKELSLLGSTQYSKDFRIGSNLFSRGALLAYELDEYIRKKTNGQKSLKNALLGMYQWTQANKRAFAYKELKAIFEQYSGVDISPVWDKWQKPMTAN